MAIGNKIVTDTTVANITVAAPAASATQMTAGRKTLGSIIKTFADNLAQLFVKNTTAVAFSGITGNTNFTKAGAYRWDFQCVYLLTNTSIANSRNFATLGVAARPELEVNIPVYDFEAAAFVGLLAISTAGVCSYIGNTIPSGHHITICNASYTSATA
jgi:hypothetical protein